MNRIALALAAVLSLPVLAVHAESPDPSGQFAASAPAGKTRAQVNAELAQYRAAGVNPWSMSYNPLASFHSAKTRAQVQAEFEADRAGVAAMTGEDSGSAYLAAHRQDARDGNQFAGQPATDAH
jgi:hypothetical protein